MKPGKCTCKEPKSVSYEKYEWQPPYYLNKLAIGYKGTCTVCDKFVHWISNYSFNLMKKHGFVEELI